MENKKGNLYMVDLYHIHGKGRSKTIRRNSVYAGSTGGRQFIFAFNEKDFLQKLNMFLEENATYDKEFFDVDGRKKKGWSIYYVTRVRFFSFIDGEEEIKVRNLHLPKRFTSNYWNKKN
jgi:hypothetical protein